MTDTEKLKQTHDVLYGHNYMVAGWHLNGALEPLDNWFDSNNWEPNAISDFDVGVEEGKRQSQDKIDRLLKLTRYHRHYDDCDILNGDCTCGLDDLIAEIEGGK
jgi:hypothetical protein